ncbi:MAG TPA: hypothetical protein VGU72_04475 [Beijerinckiaceae bacterium]|jgi:hypothetical protein|nr:hypothetical protein [Beijerinckiaceae bacterium]
MSSNPMQKYAPTLRSASQSLDDTLPVNLSHIIVIGAYDQSDTFQSACHGNASLSALYEFSLSMLRNAASAAEKHMADCTCGEARLILRGAQAAIAAMQQSADAPEATQ